MTMEGIALGERELPITRRNRTEKLDKTRGGSTNELSFWDQDSIMTFVSTAPRLNFCICKPYSEQHRSKLDFLTWISHGKYF